MVWEKNVNRVNHGGSEWYYEALQESEMRYRQLFEESPTPLWEEDCSEVKRRVDAIKAQGIGDLASYFMENKELVKELAGLVKVVDINQSALRLYKASSEKEFFFGSGKIFSEKPYENFIGTLLTIAEGGRELITEKTHLTLEGEPLEVQFSWSAASGYEETYARLLVSIVDLTERKRNENQLRYLSLHDQLTGLYNRAFFEEEMRRLGRSREYPVTIITADVDGLKMINDTLGHDRGDDLINACAGVFKKSFRDSDIIARMGGDEFSVLLPRTQGKTGEKIISRIYANVDRHNKEQPELPLSISIGLAVAKNRESLENTFKKADALMYRSKLLKGPGVRAQILNALMAALVDRDNITPGRNQKLVKLCQKVAKRIGIPSEQMEHLTLLAKVHDLGKVGIPDEILYKKGPLNTVEREIINQHPEKGFRIALASSELSSVAYLILKHHEWWNGQGYPLGIKSVDIPLECRIFAIVDAFNAMINDQSYRKAMGVDEAVEELKSCSGTQFDPGLLEVFLEVLEKDRKS